MPGWSIHLCRIRGIQLSIHASFLLLMAYGAWEGWDLAGWPGAAWMLTYLSALFACVTLHELGHAWAARRFGIQVPRILLLPIGGMAQMGSMPRRPREEIIIALAGPAVNYAIIGLLMIFVRFPDHWSPDSIDFSAADFFRHLMVVNAVMGIFNLLPAFPMDGGRVFRALLALRLSYLRATQIATGVGKVVALGGAAFLIYHEYYLGGALFAFIIYAGECELRAVTRVEKAAAPEPLLTGKPPGDLGETTSRLH